MPNTVVSETFYGYIESTKDALLIFEACKRGILPRVKRRLQDKERILIRSGTVFCFDEKESRIKRWTDGFLWSPSRISGNFLIYRELQDKKPSQDIIYEQDGFLLQSEVSRRQKEKQLVGSLKNSFRFKQHGLIKKSISFAVDGVHQHIISYYNKDHVLSGKLNTPSCIIALASLTISPGLTLKQQKLTEDPVILEEDGSFKVTQVTRRKKKQGSIPNQITTEDIPSPCSNNSSSIYSDTSTPNTNSSMDTFKEHNNTIDDILNQPLPVTHNICLDENFSNINQPHHYPPTTTSTTDYMPDHHISSSSRYYYNSNDLQHNPYQHLYSSASFHSVNHASIIRNNNIITANAFMEDINAILGWSEFELQM